MSAQMKSQNEIEVLMKCYRLFLYKKIPL